MVNKSLVLFTTARRPTGKIRAFCRDLSLRAPDINRFREALSRFSDVPIGSFRKICSGKFDAAVHISHNPSNCITATFRLLPELVDAGPKIELSDSVWELTG